MNGIKRRRLQRANKFNMNKNKPLIYGGYYIKPRKIQKSSIDDSPPHFREIWDWLIRNASHKDTNKLRRGQILTSSKEILNGLSWKVGYRTERYTLDQCKKAMKFFLKALMIATTKAPRGVLITVLNYNLYQI